MLFSPDEMMKMNVYSRRLETPVLCVFAVKECDMTRDEWAQSVPKQ